MGTELHTWTSTVVKAGEQAHPDKVQCVSLTSPPYPSAHPPQSSCVDLSSFRTDAVAAHVQVRYCLVGGQSCGQVLATSRHKEKTGKTSDLWSHVPGLGLSVANPGPTQLEVGNCLVGLQEQSNGLVKMQREQSILQPLAQEQHWTRIQSQTQSYCADIKSTTSMAKSIKSIERARQIR